MAGENKWHPDKDVSGGYQYVNSSGNFAAVSALRYTGTTLIVIPPTSDPAVSGALWNNAGTAAFSV